MTITRIPVRDIFTAPTLNDSILNCLLGNGKLGEIRKTIIGGNELYLGINRHANFHKPDGQGIKPRTAFCIGYDMVKLYSHSDKIDVPNLSKCFFQHLMSFDRAERTTELLSQFQKYNTTDFDKCALAFYNQDVIELFTA